MRRVSLVDRVEGFDLFVLEALLTDRPLFWWCGLVSEGVRWMERSMPDCTVKIMKGEGHNLLSSTKVVIEVLESIAKEAGTL